MSSSQEQSIPVLHWGVDDDLAFIQPLLRDAEATILLAVKEEDLVPGTDPKSFFKGQIILVHGECTAYWVPAVHASLRAGNVRLLTYATLEQERTNIPVSVYAIDYTELRAAYAAIAQTITHVFATEAHEWCVKFDIVDGRGFHVGGSKPVDKRARHDVREVHRLANQLTDWPTLDSLGRRRWVLDTHQDQPFCALVHVAVDTAEHEIDDNDIDWVMQALMERLRSVLATCAWSPARLMGDRVQGHVAARCRGFVRALAWPPKVSVSLIGEASDGIVMRWHKQLGI